MPGSVIRLGNTRVHESARNGDFRAVIVAIAALFVGVNALAVRLMARQRKGDRCWLLRGDMPANGEFIEPIEMEDEDDQD
jgi:hypothetical protein